MCAYTHSDQFGKITVDRGFVDRAVATGRVLESFWVHPEPRHGGGITASDPLWRSGLLGKQVRWCANDNLDAYPGPPPRA